MTSSRSLDALFGGVVVVLTESQFKEIVPTMRNAVQWVPVLRETFERFDIDNTDRVAAFIAQVAHESSNFNRLAENLSYSAKRIAQVWPKRFPTLDSAMPYAGNPEKLANRVYANIKRMHRMQRA